MITSTSNRLKQAETAQSKERDRDRLADDQEENSECTEVVPVAQSDGIFVIAWGLRGIGGAPR